VRAGTVSIRVHLETDPLRVKLPDAAGMINWPLAPYLLQLLVMPWLQVPEHTLPCPAGLPCVAALGPSQLESSASNR
jgi:hypothetical protein